MESDRDNIEIQRAIEGDPAAFEYFVAKYSDRVFALVSGIVKVREDAEEITSDIFIKVFSRLHKFRGESRFSTWLYRIAYNSAISAARKRRLHHSQIDERIIEGFDQGAEESLLREASLEKLEQALELLPAQERAIIEMFYMQKMPLEQIAGVVGISTPNAKVRVHRVRKKLALLIEKSGD